MEHWNTLMCFYFSLVFFLFFIFFMPKMLGNCPKSNLAMAQDYAPGIWHVDNVNFRLFYKF